MPPPTTSPPPVANAFKRYQAISALAGSGKTYQLTLRYLALLALGADPSRIMAITFTRKAAGEIFSRIITRLANAALTEKERTRLEADLRLQLGTPAFTLPPAAVLELLDRLLTAMPRLRIGTIDAFFGTLVKVFALELGLPPHQEMLEGDALDRAREEALAHAFALLGKDDAARQAFREAFKMATSEEARSIHDAILTTINHGHEVYLDLPVPDAWGNPDRIWATTPAWWNLPLDPHTTTARLQAFQERLTGTPGLDQTYSNAWNRFLTAALEARWDDALEGTLPTRLLDARDALAAGHADIKFGRKSFPVTGPDAADAHLALALIVRSLLRGMLQETQGMFRLLRAYDASVQTRNRDRGRLAFSDVPLLLARIDPAVMLDIDYRLDSRIDHWLIDEFQDTNARQWHVIGRLADEVLQTTEPDRSFFYVGDVKQAIYAWRGGEATLFDAVRQHYHDRFQQADVLATSWRSSPVVLDVINSLFGDVHQLPSLAAPWPRVVTNWTERWQPHLAAEKNRDLPGRVEWHEVDTDTEAETGIPPRLATTAALALDLVARGVPSIGVLVRTNSYGDRVAEELRRAGLQVRRETNPHLLDNPVVSALLSLLQLADHPGDELAWPHLRLSPLLDVLRTWSGADPALSLDDAWREHLAALTRARAARAGIAGLLGELLDLCRQHGLLDDPFIQTRIRQLIDAAEDFDRTEQGRPGEFARLAAKLTVNDPGVDGRVIVMTVHKAKGLEFDAVILPELQGHSRQWTKTNPGHMKIGGFTPDETALPDPNTDDDESVWVFPVPSAKIAALDPVIAAFATSITERRVAEELCLLYVAMTRAKQGLYLVTEPLPEKNTTLTSAKILQEALVPPHHQPTPGGRSSATPRTYTATESAAPAGPGLRYALGDPDWPARPRAETPEQPPAAPEPATLPTGLVPASNALRRLVLRTPSGEDAHPEKSAMLFAAGKNAASARGLLLHDLFSRITWLDETTAESALAAYEKENGTCPPAIRDEFTAALAAPSVAALFTRPTGRTEVWREQAFEYSDGTHWISGRIDRVVVMYNDQGQPSSAQLIDFKSDRLDGQPEAILLTRYHDQIARYTQVLCTLLDLSPSAITPHLVHLNVER